MSGNTCPQCGAPVAFGATECKYCGEPLKPAASGQPMQQPGMQGQPGYQQPAMQGQPGYQQPMYQQPGYQQPYPPQAPYHAPVPPVPPPMYNQNNLANGINPAWPIKSKGVAAILAIFLGGFGIHKFYLGKAGMGILYLLFCWTYIPAIIGFVEGIIYLASNDHNFQVKNRVRLQ